MRSMFMTAMALSLTISHALAAEPQRANAVGPSSAAIAADTASRPSIPPRAASLVDPDEPVASGDLINIDRQFDNWLLQCDLRLSRNKRLCSVGQQVDDGQGDRLFWRIAQNTESKPIVLISAPANLLRARGMRLGFTGLEKTIREEDWLCSERRCQSGFGFEGLLQVAILNAELVRFSYWITSPDGREREVEAAGSMKGFEEAIKAAAADPFGRDVAANAAAGKTQGPGKRLIPPHKEQGGSGNDILPHRKDR